MIKLGQTLRDQVTGFTGIATQRIEYLNGCTQYLLSPPVDKDGKFIDGTWFDHQRLDVVEEAKATRRSDTGGPTPTDKAPMSYRG